MLCIAAGSFMALSTNTSFAQATETTVKFNKTDAGAFTTTIEAPKDVVAGSMEDYFKKTFSSKSSSSKGYKLYKGVLWNEVSTDKLDVYYKVEGKKNNSQVFLLVSKGYDNFTTTQNDPQTAQGAINFLSGLNVKVSEYSKTMAVAASSKVLDDAQKDYNKYVKRDEDLKKQKEKLEKDIADNQSKMGDREKELNNAKSKLDEVKQ
ncbi:hypothetical protein DBR32_12710 [Taibaiella sp. KBW10]|nr:hypothetical protein DBR32_12710 [Taibaiella sp. KBW10]